MMPKLTPQQLTPPGVSSAENLLLIFCFLPITGKHGKIVLRSLLSIKRVVDFKAILSFSFDNLRAYGALNSLTRNTVS